MNKIKQTIEKSANSMDKKVKQKIITSVAIGWTTLLLILQLIFFHYYESHKILMLLSNERIVDFISVLGLFGIGEIFAALILTKENFIKFNALYTFILTIILTIGAAVVAAAIVGSFHILYFLSYLLEENGMQHIPFYNFMSAMYISFITLLGLTIPDKYFGKIKYKRKQLIILIFYFIIISIHF